MGMNLHTGDSSDDEPMTEMNMTPLIDVMLVLLIMLIITIPIQDHSVDLNTPAPSPVTDIKQPVVDTVDVKADGTWVWNGVTVPDRATLEGKLRVVATQPDQDEVHIRPDGHVEYKWVAAVLASAQRVGVVKLGVIGNEQFADGN